MADYKVTKTGDNEYKVERADGYLNDRHAYLSWATQRVNCEQCGKGTYMEDAVKDKWIHHEIEGENQTTHRWFCSQDCENKYKEAHPLMSASDWFIEHAGGLITGVIVLAIVIGIISISH